MAAEEGTLDGMGEAQRCMVEYAVARQPERTRFRCSCPDQRRSGAGGAGKRRQVLALVVVDRAAGGRVALAAERRGRGAGQEGGFRA